MADSSPGSEPGAPGGPVGAGASSQSSLRGRMGSVAAASAVALVVGQALSLAQTVALARLLSPLEVGFFAAGSVTTAFVSNVVDGGLRAGLIHREDRLEDAAETVFRATLVTGAIMSLLTLAAAPLIGTVFADATAGVVAASMAGGIFLFAFSNVPESLLQRQFSVKRRLIVGPTYALVFAVVSVTLAALGFGVWSLVIGSYASTLTWVALLWILCDWRPGRGRADAGMYREMLRYGAPLAISSFADQSVKLVQAVVTGRFLSVSALGLFRYGERIAQIPVGVIVDVGANSLFPAYSRIAAEPERFRVAYLRALNLVVVIAAAMSGLLLALGEPLVVVVLGEQWRGAGLALMAMAGLGLGTALATSAEAIKGAGRTTSLNWVTLIETVLGIGLVVVMVQVWGLVGVGLSISLTSLIAGASLVAIARPILGLAWRQVLGAIVPPVVAAVVPVLAAGALERFVLDATSRPVGLGVLALVADGVLFTVVYVVALRVVAPRSFRLALGVVGSMSSAVTRRLGR